MCIKALYFFYVKNALILYKDYVSYNSKSTSPWEFPLHDIPAISSPKGEVPSVNLYLEYQNV
jgi:hypothetical protein